MADPTLDRQIDHLHELREQVAEKARQLAHRELSGRILRLTVETELRQAGHTQTDAEKQARIDPRYIGHERQSIQITFDRAVLEADAEAERFAIELQLAVLRRTEVGA